MPNKKQNRGDEPLNRHPTRDDTLRVPERPWGVSADGRSLWKNTHYKLILGAILTWVSTDQTLENVECLLNDQLFMSFKAKTEKQIDSRKKWLKEMVESFQPSLKKSEKEMEREIEIKTELSLFSRKYADWFRERYAINVSKLTAILRSIFRRNKITVEGKHTITENEYEGIMAMEEELGDYDIHLIPEFVTDTYNSFILNEFPGLAKIIPHTVKQAQATSSLGTADPKMAGGAVEALAVQIDGVDLGSETAAEIAKLCFTCARMPQMGKTKMCSVCKAIRYCSKECQKEDWERHKLQCKKSEKPPTVGSARPKSPEYDGGPAARFKSNL